MCSPAKIQKTQKVAQAEDRRPPRRCFLKLPYASLRRERKTASRLRDPPATRRGNTKPSTILTSVAPRIACSKSHFSRHDLCRIEGNTNIDQERYRGQSGQEAN